MAVIAGGVVSSEAAIRSCVDLAVHHSIELAGGGFWAKPRVACPRMRRPGRKVTTVSRALSGGRAFAVRRLIAGSLPGAPLNEFRVSCIALLFAA
jgi:hypothetical protein